MATSGFSWLTLFLGVVVVVVEIRLMRTYRAMVENEKAKLHRVDGEVITKEKGWLALLWDLVLVSMLLYFLASIINSSAQHYIVTKDEEEIQWLKKKQEGKAT